jgi:tRNA A37 threonylcarbamoyladenosine biosynthesis protein TsaE
MSPHGNRDADALSLGLDDLIGAPDVVVLIEWAEVVPSLLSSATLVVHMTAESEARTLLIAARDTRGIELLSAL